MARTVEDAAIVLNHLVGYDDKDPVCSDRPAPDYASQLGTAVRGVRLGIPQQFFNEHVDAEIAQAVAEAIKLLEKIGAQLVPINVAHLELCSPMSAHLTLVEAASYHEPNMRKRMADFGDDPRLRLEAGRCLLATDYVKSQRARTLLGQTLAKIFSKVDVLVTPTLPAFPQAIGEYYVQSGDLREHVVDAFTRFAVPFNLTGLPAISLPCGFNRKGLPIGLQIVGRAFDEATVLRVGHVYQLNTDWHKRRPAI
jgi:aspartyl-tRNA(Asn)/glutamyl-tRNA(Gln) amidotransferase subunit A